MAFRISLRSYSVLQNEFKDSMSRIGCQAMILTAGQKSNARGSLHGMTLSSTCSLSVYPKPLLQFNLHLPSYTSQNLHELKLLALHVLPPSANAVKLGRIFANGVKRPPQSNQLPDNEDGDLFHEKTTPFTNLETKEWNFHTIENVNIPILQEAERVFICKKNEVFEVDKHEIWVVEVLDILKPRAELAEGLSGGLLYHNRNFHKVGPILTED